MSLGPERRCELQRGLLTATWYLTSLILSFVTSFSCLTGTEWEALVLRDRHSLVMVGVEP